MRQNDTDKKSIKNTRNTGEDAFDADKMALCEKCDNAPVEK